MRGFKLSVILVLLTSLIALTFAILKMQEEVLISLVVCMIFTLLSSIVYTIEEEHSKHYFKLNNNSKTTKQ